VGSFFVDALSASFTCDQDDERKVFNAVKTAVDGNEFLRKALYGTQETRASLSRSTLRWSAVAVSESCSPALAMIDGTSLAFEEPFT
jgi:hypothetical protein